MDKIIENKHGAFVNENEHEKNLDEANAGINLIKSIKFQTALDAYIADMQAKHNEYCKEHLTNLYELYNGQYETFKVEKGQRYAKVLRLLHGEKSGSVHCFVEIATGDILKAASFKTPQKNGKRGNLYTEKKPIFSRDFYVR